MKILCFIPTYRHNAATLFAVHALQWRGVLDVVFSRDNPNIEKPTLNIIHQFEKAQTLVSQGGYSHVLTVEDDMLPPPDALEKLYDAMESTGAGVAYGVYHFRRLSMTCNVLDARGTSIASKEYKKQLARGGIYESGGLGYGTTLIRADVFASAKLETRNGSGTDSDTHFAEYCRKNGVKQITHFGVLCGHLRPDGIALWPGNDIDKPISTRHINYEFRNVRAIHSFGGRHPEKGQFIVKQGETAMIDSDLAQVLQGAGILEYA